MAGNDDLHPILSNIHKTLGDVLQAIQKVKGEVEKVHTAIREGTEAIVDAIHDTIQAQAEMKMMERVAEVREIKPQIQAEKERVETEQEELDRQLERIAERYEQKHEELDEKAAQRIRDLGSHIFEIDEEQFEAGIEEPFAEHVTTAWMSFQEHNSVVERDRQERVEGTTGDVVAEIHDFVDQQRELVEEIRRVRSDLRQSLSQPRTIQVPYYVVTVETDGTVEQRVVAPSVVSDGEGPCSVSLQPLPGMEQLVAGTELNEPQVGAVASETVRRSIEPYVEDDRPLVSYGSAVESALPEQIEVAVEGGE